MTRKPTIWVAALLLLAIVSGISMASAAADVCRDLPAGDQTAGTTMPVDIIVTLDGATAYMIEDTVPTGWTITSAPGGTILGSGSKVSYSALSGAVDTTFTYQVAIPSGTTPGQYCFTGEFGIGTDPLGPLDCGDMCVDVVSDGPSEADVCRDLPAGDQTADTTMPVELVLTLDGATAYMIEDTVPTGWTITSAPGGTILGSGSKVSYSALSGAVDTTFTYQVAIPSGTTPGQYCFTGEFGIGTDPLGPLDCGDMCVDVVSDGPSEADVCRDLPAGDQTADTTMPVELVLTLDGATAYMIEDTVPTGWTITSAPGGTILGSGSKVSYSALSGAVDTTFTYQVAIPSGTTPGQYCFTGEFGIGTDPLGPLDCGDMCVDVVSDGPSEADVCRDLPAGVQSDTTMPVELVLTLDGATAYMIEDTVPTGWTITSAPGGTILGSGSKVSYSALSGAVDTTFTYQVAIPSGTTPGQYCFTGEFGIGTDPLGPLDCGDICVEVTDNDDPTVTLIFPTGGEGLSGEVTLNASAIADPDGSIVSVVFHHSDDGGSTWNEIGTGAASGIYYTCTWDTKTVDNGDYKVKAVAEDDLVGTGADEDESGVFTIDNGFCITLDAGWNMVSIPKKIDSSSSNAAPDVFNLVGGETCDYYNGCTGEWSSNWDVNVVPCRGYFVYKLAPETICVDLDTGNSAPPSQYLCAGWNLVGHIDTSEMSVENFASVTTLDDKIAQVWHRTSDGTWTGYPQWTLDTMTPGDGYWLLMSTDGTMYGTP